MSKVEVRRCVTLDKTEATQNTHGGEKMSKRNWPTDEMMESVDTAKIMKVIGVAWCGAIALFSCDENEIQCFGITCELCHLSPDNPNRIAWLQSIIDKRENKMSDELRPFTVEVADGEA